MRGLGPFVLECREELDIDAIPVLFEGYIEGEHFLLECHPDADRQPALHAFVQTATDALRRLDVPATIVATGNLEAAYRVRGVPGSYAAPGYTPVALVSMRDGVPEILVDSAALEGRGTTGTPSLSRVRRLALHEVVHAFLGHHMIGLDLGIEAGHLVTGLSPTAGYLAMVSSYALQEYTADLWAAHLSVEQPVSRYLPHLAADWKRAQPGLQEASRVEPSRESVRLLMPTVIGYLRHIAQAAVELRLIPGIDKTLTIEGLPDGIGVLLRRWAGSARALGDAPSTEIDRRIAVTVDWSLALADWMSQLVGFRVGSVEDPSVFWMPFHAAAE